MSDPSDEIFLRRAIRLAMNGRGLVEPNPMVGCVLTKNGQIIGEGWHGKFGGPHAEPTALADCRSRGNSPEGATAYVTLEPCCHTNKKTPPCVPALIEAKVTRVVIGSLDPNPDVNGKGVTLLREAGIEVATGVCEAEAKQLIAPFISAVNGDSCVTLKWAESADGKVAGPGGRRTQISGPESSGLVHLLRARSEAIVIGIGTALMDDPLLTPRDVPIRHKPTRIVLDPQLRLPPTSQLAQTAGEWPTAVIHDEWIARKDAVRRLRDKGVAVYCFEHFGKRRSPADAADAVRFIRENMGLRDLFVEPGPTLARSFLPTSEKSEDVPTSVELVDRLWVFRSPTVIDNATAPAAPSIPDWLVPTGTLRIGDDTLTEYRASTMLKNPTNDDGSETWPVVPSADFVLASEQSSRSGTTQSNAKRLWHGRLAHG